MNWHPHLASPAPLLGLLAAVVALSGCNEVRCARQPEVVTDYWGGFRSELSSRYAPFDIERLLRSRELDYVCRVDPWYISVDGPTPIITVDGAPVELVADEIKDTLWWPVAGAWPEGELVLTGVEERTGPDWDVNERLTIAADAPEISLEQTELAGRVFQLQSFKDAYSVSGFGKEADFERMYLGFTEEPVPSAVLFDVPIGAREGLCTHPLTTERDETGALSLALPERQLSYALHDDDPYWKDSEPLLGPATFTMWESPEGLLGRGWGRASISALIWSEDLLPYELPELASAIEIPSYPCGSGETCIDDTLWDIRFKEVELSIPDEECGDRLQAPPMLCAVSTLPLGVGPLMIAMLALRRRRQTSDVP